MLRTNNAVAWPWIAIFFFPASLCSQDAREIVRTSVTRDQANWLRAKDYTWTVHRVERQLDSNGRIKSEKREAWDTLILYGEPHKRYTERNSRALTPDELRKQQQRLDQEIGRLRDESPQQKERRLADEERKRRKDREFLQEIPDVFDLRIEREDVMDGRGVWVISANPKPGYRPRTSDARNMQKTKGTLWIDKSEYQWVRVEAETIGTITFGIFIGRINPGARLLFEQTRVNDELWLPKRSFVSGVGRIVGKKIAAEEEITWSDFRKFRVESNIVADSSPSQND